MRVLPSSAPSVPAEFAAIPISISEVSASLQICLIVHKQPDPVSGDFLLLRHFSGGRALLGCVRDRGGQVVEWLEVWVQSPQAAGPSPAASNAAGDEGWTQLAAALRAAEPQNLLGNSAEAEPPFPTFLDLSALQPWHPFYEGKNFRVCRDDTALEQRGLPRYTLTTTRYGWVPELGVDSPFVALTPESPGGDFPLSSEAERFASFNPSGGRLIVRRFAPLPVEAFAALLAGVPWKGAGQALRHCPLASPYTLLQDEDTIRHGGRHFFTSRGGQAGRLAETLHLKLSVALQCLKLVRDYTEKRQLPLLNLTAETFRVRLPEGDFDLPIFWSAQVSLAQPGVAAPVPIPNTQTRYFRPLQTLGESIYRPEELSRRRRGTATLRIRAVLPPAADGTVVEGTLITHEELRAESHEMIELVVPFAASPLTLYVHLDANVTSGSGESGFRSVPLTFTDTQRQTLQAAAGVIFTEVPLEIQTPLSSPCDLYSLGVLALRILFAGSEVTLPVFKDRLFSLAATVAGTGASAEGGVSIITGLLEQEERWREALGPQHLLAEELAAPAAAGLLPPAIWAEILAVLLRFFPGRSPQSFCSDLADAPALALHTIYDAPLAALQRLQRLTRSLHLLDWTSNREVSSLLREWASDL